MAQPPHSPQQPPLKKKTSCLVVGLVLLAVSVPVLGIFSVLAISGVRRYLAAAKTAEAKNTVNAIARAGVAAYERDTVIGSKDVHRLCGSATPVPAAVPAGSKYTPSPAPGTDFKSGNASAGWMCLKFAVEQPMYYQYAYEKGAGSGKSGATANGFEVRARGDLDGNGVYSLFARGADVRDGIVLLGTQLYVENELE